MPDGTAEELNVQTQARVAVLETKVKSLEDAVKDIATTTRSNNRLLLGTLFSVITGVFLIILSVKFLH